MVKILKIKILFVITVLIILISVGLYHVKNDYDYTLSTYNLDKLTQEEVSKIRKYDKPYEHAKYFELLKTSYGATKSDYPHGYLQKAMKDMNRAIARRAVDLDKRSAAKASSGIFIENGPSNVPGRTRTVLVLPEKDGKSAWVAGSVSGGIWKSEDEGQSWKHKTKGFGTLTISHIVTDKVGNTLYAGTGEVFGPNRPNGSGLLVSHDSGETWDYVASTKTNPKFANINRIVVNPDNVDELLVATTSILGVIVNDEPVITGGIFKSTDGGTTWKNVYQTDGSSVAQIIADPKDFSKLYAAVLSGPILKSTDTGETWEEKASYLSNEGRTELAIAQNDTRILYALVNKLGIAGSGSDLYASYDAAETFSLVKNASGINVNYLGGQGNYNNTVMVNPFNDSEVYLGGVDLFKAIVTPTNIRTNVFVSLDLGEGDFLKLVNFGGSAVGGRVSLGDGIGGDDLVSLEIRFGPNKKQKAYRFTVNKKGADVSDNEYIYRDYVEIPIEVWDITNNKQLNVSFRDQQEDGQWNLRDEYTNDSNPRFDSREYLFIHTSEYSDTSTAKYAVNGGHKVDQLYFIWPTLTDDTNITGRADFPDNTVSIKTRSVLLSESSTVVAADTYLVRIADKAYHGIENVVDKYGLHPDHHLLTPIIIDGAAKTWKILNGNDGGVYISDPDTTPGINYDSWNYAGSGYNTAQFYSADKHPFKRIYIGGTQDNGTNISNRDQNASKTTKYHEPIAGDGFQVVYHGSDPNLILGSSYHNDILKSTNGGFSFTKALTGLQDLNFDDSPFVTQLANAKTKPNQVVLIGASGAWVTQDFGNLWKLATHEGNYSFNGVGSAAVSIADPSIIYFGNGMIKDEADIFVSTDSGHTFKATTVYQTVKMNAISGIATHPTEPNTAYVLFSQRSKPKILRTKDKGASWEDISGFETQSTVSTKGFPNVGVNSLLVHPDDPLTIWAGTEIGIYESNDDGASWHPLDGDLPRTQIMQMKVVGNEIVIATFGRGIWSYKIESVYTADIPPILTATGLNPSGDLALSVDLRQPFDLLEVHIDGESVKSVQNVEKQNRFVITVPVTNEKEEVTVSVVGKKGNKIEKSNEMTSRFIKLKENKETLYSIFQDNLWTNRGGFKLPISNNIGLNTGNNPLPQGFDANSLLMHPITVNDYSDEIELSLTVLMKNFFASDKTTAIEAGTYFSVEGTKDGLTWTPLMDPIDSRAEDIWDNSFRDIVDFPTSIQRVIKLKLKDTYKSGDKILLRLRAVNNFSDPVYKTSSGVRVYSIWIQKPVVGLADRKVSTTSQALIYPQPQTDNPLLNIKFEAAKYDGDTHILIYNSQGEAIRTYQLNQNALRNGVFSFSTTNLTSGVYFARIVGTNNSKTIRFTTN